MCIFSEMNEFFILLFKNREGMIFALSCILEKRISLQSLNFSWAEEHSQMEHSLLLCTCTNWQNFFFETTNWQNINGEWQVLGICWGLRVYVRSALCPYPVSSFAANRNLTWHMVWGPFLSPLLVAIATLLLMTIAHSALRRCCSAPRQQWRIPCLPFQQHKAQPPSWRLLQNSLLWRTAAIFLWEPNATPGGPWAY